MNFTFAIITYNQEKYVLETLESIKYQITNFGENISFQLIVADDCSVDNTIEYIEFWVKENRALFKQIDIVTDYINRGTCENFTKVWGLIKGDYCKFIAGDDLFSVNNVFEYLDYSHYDIVSALPLCFIENKIVKDDKEVKNIIASDLMNEKNSFMKRITNTGVINTPSLFLNIDFYKQSDVKKFITSYKIIEDYPHLIALAEKYPDMSFKLINKVMVLYRRTKNSAYIIKASDFYKDRVELFNYLISKEPKESRKLLQKNRLWCFTINNKILKKTLNISNYIFIFKYIYNFPRILKKYKSLELEKKRNQKYLLDIENSAKNIIDKIRNRKMN